MVKKVFELQAVSKIFNEALEKKAKRAVDSLSFSVESGGIIGFVGPNGAGKTTTIKMILGLVRPTKGIVTLMGMPASNPRARSDVSFVSEQPYFYAHLTAEETLRFIYRMKQLSVKDQEQEIDRVLEVVGLPGKRKVRVNAFSKGMQQRLNMAQAIMGNPQLIIMDEPMSGMDPLGRRLFREIFRHLAANGTTIFFSTHIVDDVENLCDRVVVLSEGRLFLEGAVQDLLVSTDCGIEYCFENVSASDVQFFQSFSDQIDSASLIPGEYQITLPQSSMHESFFRAMTESTCLVPLSITPIRRSLEDILYASQLKESL